MSAAFLLILIATAYRIILGVAGVHGGAWLPNFSPLAAIALCGAVWLPRKYAYAVPFTALLVSDIVLNAAYGVPLFHPAMLASYTAIGLVCWIGLHLRPRPTLGRLLAGSATGSVLFYLLTNSAAWCSSGDYALNFHGWLQALTTGLPGFPPTWMFFRNSLASDLLFTVLFVACMSVSRARKPGDEGLRGQTVKAAAL